MIESLDKLKYGSMKFDSVSLDIFWLEGESKISQMQQIDFLERLYLSKLPISKRTETIMKRLLVIKETNEYNISGKTGWSMRNGQDNGWFVGYVESQGKTYFFATNIDPTEQFDMNKFSATRKEITYRALEHLKIIK